MHSEALRYLVCPACGGALELLSPQEGEGEIVQATLRCTAAGCARTFPVEQGLPDLFLPGYVEEMDTVRSFGFEWGRHLQGGIERETVFGRTLEEDLALFFQVTHLGETDLRDKVILDAGCGSGALTRALTRYGPRFVFGVDINDATLLAHRRAQDDRHCQILRADIINLPFPDGCFDIVWCHGVLHHTPDTAEAFRALARKVRVGGVMYVWVYRKGFYPFHTAKDLFRSLRLDRLPVHVLFQLTRGLAVGSLLLHGLYRLLFGLPVLLLAGKESRLRRTLRYRPYHELLMTWFDALSPRFDHRHTREEVEGWFRDCGFADLHLWDNQVGMVGRRVR